jgi:type VI secretion system protein ImpC
LERLEKHSERQLEERAVPATGSLLDVVLAASNLSPGDRSYNHTRRGVEALLSALLRDEAARARQIDPTMIDMMIADIDEKISAQLNEILHHRELMTLESAWRGLGLMVERIDFHENIALEVLSVSKEELRRDFDDAPEIPSSGLYQIVYAREYGVFGGRPYGLVTANYDFGPDAYDLELLRQCAAVSAMAHAIFIGNASPKFFGRDDLTGLSSLGDLSALFEGPQYTAWRAFRDTEDSRYVGLCLPRFLLRRPYSEDHVRLRKFAFKEDIDGRHDRYLWGHASVAFATRVADSFARYRWCPNVIGPNAGGAVSDMVLEPYSVLAGAHARISTETLITDRRELELSELGFIPFVHRRPESDACFFSASSVQKPKRFGEAEGGQRAETNHRLGTQLPYMFVITRLAHYIKVKQRELIGGARTVADIQRDINQWIIQYVADVDDPAPAIRAKRPLRAAHVAVDEESGNAGWYRCRITVQPHFKYMGASFTLSLLGKLDREER